MCHAGILHLWVGVLRLWWVRSWLVLVFLQLCFSVCLESVIVESFQYNVFYDGLLFLPLCCLVPILFLLFSLT